MIDEHLDNFYKVTRHKYPKYVDFVKRLVEHYLSMGARTSGAGTPGTPSITIRFPDNTAVFLIGTDQSLFIQVYFSNLNKWIRKRKHTSDGLMRLVKALAYLTGKKPSEKGRGGQPWFDVETLLGYDYAEDLTQIFDGLFNVAFTQGKHLRTGLGASSSKDSSNHTEVQDIASSMWSLLTNLALENKTISYGNLSYELSLVESPSAPFSGIRPIRTLREVWGKLPQDQGFKCMRWP